MAPATATVQVEYAAPVGCPDRNAFVQALFSRVPHASEVDESPEVRLNVSLAADGNSSLTIEIPEGSSRREIFGSCRDAVDSMLVIAAMVVEAEPSARLAAADIVPTQQAPVATAPAPAPAAPPAVLHPTAPSAANDRASVPERAQRANSAWFGSIGLGGTIESALQGFQAPGVSAGFAYGGKPSNGGGPGSRGELGKHENGSSNWAPAAVVELLAAPPSSQNASQGAVNLYLVAGRASACARAQISNAWHFWPCATFDAGLLVAKGQDVDLPESHSMPWLAPGAALRLDCELSERWVLEAVLGGRGLLRHDLFYFRPKQTAYAVPAYSLGAGLNLRARVF